MLDIDDYEPDQSGSLDLRYCGWFEVEPRVLTFGSRLLHLDISFNQLVFLPSEISSLCLLQELNVSCNKLQTLPQEIGTLSWLRVIKANGNRLQTLPAEIGSCKNLETLNLSENILTSIPQEIAGCLSLRTLLLQNNDLPRLPLSLASLKGQIQKLDISNNNNEMTTTLPIAIHRDTDSIMWLLSLQKEKRHCIDRLKQDVKLLQHDNIAAEKELADAKDKIAMLEERKQALEADFESVRHFLVARAHYREFRIKMLHYWQEMKRACAQKIR